MTNARQPRVNDNATTENQTHTADKHAPARRGTGLDCRYRDSPVRVVHGHPSLINYLDALYAWQLVREAGEATDMPAATSFKHVSPAGAAIAGPVDDVMRSTWALGNGEISEVTSAYARATRTSRRQERTVTSSA